MTDQSDGELATGENPVSPQRSSWLRRNFQDRKERKEKEPAQDRAARRNSTATIFIALFSLCALIVALTQCSVYRDQAKTMKGQQGVMILQLKVAQADQRAWISDVIKVTEPITYDQQGMRIAVQFFLLNSGRSPALYTYAHYKAFVQSKGVTVADQQRKVCEPLRRISRVATDEGTAVFPNQPQTIGTIVEHIPWAELNNSPVDVWIAGCIDYQFPVFDGHHQTGFANHIQRFEPEHPDVALPLVVNETVPVNLLRIGFENGAFYVD